MGSWGLRDRCKGSWVESREKGRIQESSGKRNGWDGGSGDMGSVKYISSLREPF